MGRRTMINLVFFLFVFLVMCVWAVQNIVVIDAINKPYTITGEFKAASGILPNAEVAYLGVHYGRVSSVEPATGGVKMTMKIDRDKKDIRRSRSPASSASRPSASRTSTSSLPTASTRRTPSRPTSCVTRLGAVEQTQNPLEFSELLRSASRLLHAIDPQKADR